MNALEYMEKQLQKHKANYAREFARGVPEEMLTNIALKVSYYKSAVEALRDVDSVLTPIKPKADSTLHSMKKDELVEYVRCLEHNYNVAVSFNENQARYIESLNTVTLPCSIGDKVYRVDRGNFFSDYRPFVQELTVTEISWKHEKYGDKDLGFAIIADGIRYKFTSIGKSVFLTREEAEAHIERSK